MDEKLFAPSSVILPDNVFPDGLVGEHEVKMIKIKRHMNFLISKFNMRSGHLLSFSIL